MCRPPHGHGSGSYRVRCGLSDDMERDLRVGHLMAMGQEVIG